MTIHTRQKQKAKRIKVDPTLVRLSSIQTYINTLFKRGEISEDDKTLIRPKAASLAKAHGSIKTHKPFNEIPKFRPIIDTTNTTHYCVGKFLSTSNIK